MTRREVVGRYRGSVIGLFWSLLYPVLMLAVYTFVFSVAFRARWGTSDSKTDFALMVFVGMIVHGLFAECVARAPGLIVGNPNLVKKVVFPLETLPWVSLCSALFHAGVSTLVLLLFHVAFSGYLPWTAILFPLVLLPLAVLTIGASWCLASLGVYLRDVGQVMGILTTILLFLSPVFYPVTALPEEYRVIFRLNPLTPVIEQARGVLILGLVPQWHVWAVYFGAALITAWLGLVWFQKTRRGFADVL
jgi:homopolymeric O-antigen transport system permease protein